MGRYHPENGHQSFPLYRKAFAVVETVIGKGAEKGIRTEEFPMRLCTPLSFLQPVQSRFHRFEGFCELAHGAAAHASTLEQLRHLSRFGQTKRALPSFAGVQGNFNSVTFQASRHAPGNERRPSDLS